MQNENLTMRIELFGSMVEELTYWNDVCNNEEGDALEYAESKFEDSLAAVKDFRAILIDDLYGYVADCKEFDEPIDLNYYRILKQLEQSTFEVRYV